MAVWGKQSKKLQWKGDISLLLKLTKTMKMTKDEEFELWQNAKKKVKNE